MARERMFGYDPTCDSCSVYYDGDPLTLLEVNNPVPDTVRDISKIRTLINFWLCGDCAPEYPNGAKDFFVPEYFEDIPKCANCGDEEVESKGHFCDYCDRYTATPT